LQMGQRVAELVGWILQNQLAGIAGMKIHGDGGL